ncbi:MAG TPA: hypothetical protein PKV59_04885, partial [Flexilinea sp.]|nr:hypothetical protein [Flexilinea sp.]
NLRRRFRTQNMLKSSVMKSKTNAVPIRRVITFRPNVPVSKAKITEKDNDYWWIRSFFPFVTRK